MVFWCAVSVLLGFPGRAHAGGVETLRTDLETLCGYHGRGNGTPDLEQALSYVETRFRELGVAPATGETFRQNFPGPGGDTLVNLIGIIGNRNAERHVVLAAHVDHLGRGVPGEANHGTVHPGADDNASGVAALLEIAGVLRKEAPSRAVLVLVFSGEEIGLLGSAYYVAHPVLPLEQCTAMVNLDTVGRMSKKTLTVFGSSTAMELPNVLQGVNVGFGLNLVLPEQDPGGSDQASFGKTGIPALHVFTGANADYHRPSDTPDRVNLEGLEQVAGFAAELTLYLADRQDPLTFVPPGATHAAPPPAPADRGERRVSFGSIPDFNHQGKGTLLSGVIPGSPASEAGLRAGDLIVVFAEVEIEDLRSFSDVLRGLSPGDAVTVVFERDGERHTVASSVVERK
jgi:hypothetical protein